MRRYPRTTIAASVALGVIAFGLLFVMLFDFKSYVERRATTALGRPVTIEALHLRIFPLEAVLENLNVADGPVGEALPAGKPPFMKAEHVDAVLGFWRLVAGDLMFKHLTVEKAIARIERRADGSLSWDVGAPKVDAAEIAKNPTLPEIRDLRLTDVQMLYRDDSTKTRLTLTLNTREAANGGEPSLLVRGEGTYAGAPSKLEATGGSILKLRDAESPYPVTGTLTSGATTIMVKGTVVDPANISGLDINLVVKGEDAADLYRVAGVALPPTPPYTIDTHLDRDGARWIFKNLKWLMGESDFAGELVWDLTSPKPMLTGEMHAKAVALKDLGGFIGAAPGEAETPLNVRREAADRERERRVRVDAPAPDQAVAAELFIPDMTFDLQKLNSMNAKVHVDAAKIIDPGFPLDRFEVDVVLQDGLLSLKPLIFEVDNGFINIDLAMNTRVQPAKTDISAVVKNFPLQRLTGKSGDNTSWGVIGGRITLHGTGNSMHKILAASDGEVGLAMGGGELSLFIVELAGIDIAETLGILLSKDKPTPIRCMVADYGIEKGKMQTRTMVFDTSDTRFNGSGSIDLGREVFDMRIHAKPKDTTPVALRSKLLLTGTFAHPSFGPDTKNMILRGGAAAALGVFLTPLASLIALIDFGGGKDADCAALIGSLQK